MKLREFYETEQGVAARLLEVYEGRIVEISYKAKTPNTFIFNEKTKYELREIIKELQRASNFLDRVKI